MNKQKANISFSGGETSAYMTQRLICELSDEYEFVVTFANTGQEAEETLEFVDKCDKYFGLNVQWVEAAVQEGRVGTKHRIVDFKSASRDGEPFEAVIAKYGIPNIGFPHCSRELKQRPIDSAVGAYFGTKNFLTFIGIRADEIDRMTSIPSLRYPLVDWGITKPHVNSFWTEQPFRLVLKGYEGNCKTCWKKSKRKLLTIAQQHRDWFEFFEAMESRYENVLPSGKKAEKYLLPARFFRGKLSCADLLAESAKGGFAPAEDDKFIYLDEEMDLEGGCGSESCEVYQFDIFDYAS